MCSHLVHFPFLQVGCDGHLWKQHVQLLQQLKQQARDGTLSEVLQQPIVGWHVKTEASSSHRERREVGISQDIDSSMLTAVEYSLDGHSFNTGVILMLLLVPVTGIKIVPSIILSLSPSLLILQSKHLKFLICSCILLLVKQCY